MMKSVISFFTFLFSLLFILQSCMAGEITQQYPSFRLLHSAFALGIPGGFGGSSVAGQDEQALLMEVNLLILSNSS